MVKRCVDFYLIKGNENKFLTKFLSFIFRSIFSNIKCKNVISLRTFANPFLRSKPKSLQKSLFSFKKTSILQKKRRRTESNEKRSRMKGLDQKVLCVPVLAQRERERRETERIDSYTAGLARRWYARVIRYNRIMRAAICGRKSGRSRPRLEHSVFCGLPWGTRIRL